MRTRIANSNPFSSKNANPHALRYAMTYIAFLLVCLVLSLIVAVSAANNARTKYWSFHSANLEVDISNTDSDLAMMENYARQLSTDSTFVRFSNMKGLEEHGFVFTAYTVMRNLSLRQYGLTSLPVTTYIYLPESGYVISPSQFTEVSQFYRYNLAYPPHLEDVWLGLLEHHGSYGSCFSLNAFGQSPSDIAFAYDIGSLLTANVPAIVWYELDTTIVRKRFLSSGADNATLLIADENGTRQLMLREDGSLPGNTLLTALEHAEYDELGFARQGDMQFIRKTGENGWHYYLALPLHLSDNVMGKYPLVYLMILLSALLFGAVLVIVLVRQSMQPLHQLSHALSKAKDDNVQMQKIMDKQRPALCRTYLRTILSGHVASDEEFSYMMRYLGLGGDYQHIVLFCTAFRQPGAPLDENELHQLVLEQMAHYLNTGHPLQYYRMPAQEYVVLVSYGKNEANPLADLTQRVTALHNALADQYSLWFYAGAGAPCTQPRLLWESYEQARTAYRYAARTQYLLPYPDIRKDMDIWYYPVEISAKLLHFIVTGNRPQVQAMFSLIHRENIEERSLPVHMLGFLLSDLRNTLFKARYQIKHPQNMPDTLDQQLFEANTFMEMEACALALAGLFVKTAEPSDPIPEIQRYLQENFSDPSLCLSKLSGMFNISESYLSHLFKDRTGQNFSTHLENLRMDEAQRRLKSRDCSLSTLYTELGYTNPTTWRRAFKKRFGITPSEMLEQNNP